MDNELLVPVLKVADASLTAKWYKKLGFEVTGVYRHEPGFPAYMFLKKKDMHIHLSEHEGDGVEKTLIYYYVSNLDEISKIFNVRILHQAWGREVHLTDPDGNRLRLGDM